MAERIDLITPDQAVAGASDYHVAAQNLDWDGVRVNIRLISSNGIARTFTFAGAEAAEYLRDILIRDSSAVSLHRWTLNLLVRKGLLKGGVSGTPG